MNLKELYVQRGQRELSGREENFGKGFWIGTLRNTAESTYRGRRFKCNETKLELICEVDLWGVPKKQNYVKDGQIKDKFRQGEGKQWKCQVS